MDGAVLKRFLSNIWKRVWLIALITVMVVAISWYLNSYVIETKYQTFTTLLVGKTKGIEDNLEYSDILLNQNLVNTYREIIKSKTVLIEVIKNLNLNTSYESLRQKINVTLMNGTEIIRIEVNYNNPILAERIANEISAVFMKTVRVLMKIDNVQVIDKAEVPLNTSNPSSIENITIATIIGIMIGIFVVVFFDHIDNTFHSIEDVERYVQLPIIGTIPKNNQRQKRKNMKKFKCNEIDITSNPKSLEAEAYRTLRTNLQFLNTDKDVRCIVITSPQPKDGKSTITANLAYVMAQTDKKILMIDGDLRKPKMHSILGFSNTKGLTNLLASNADIEDFIYKRYDENSNYLPSGPMPPNRKEILNSQRKEKYIINKLYDGNLYFISAGPIPPNPSELLNSNRMEKLIELLRKEYDLILIDSPPLGLVTDAAILSAIADGTVLVCSTKETTIANTKKTKNTLEKINVHILGIIINKLQSESRQYYKDNYYYG